MTQTTPIAPDSDAAVRVRPSRLLALLVLLVLLAAAIFFLFGTEHGRLVRHHPRDAGEHVRQWVAQHRVIAPVVFLSVYVIFTILCLPVWWLQVLGGFGFGIWTGVFWSLCGSTVGATAASVLARWLAADWFHKRVEGRLQQLRALDEKLDQNGLLVVIITRLIHGVPFGLSNYAFGLIGIPLRDVALGTLLGSIPAITLVVMLGVDHKKVLTWHFFTLQVCMYLILLVPLLVHYLRPRTAAARVPPDVTKGV